MNKSRGSEPRISLEEVPDTAWPMVFRFRRRGFHLVLGYRGFDQLHGTGERTKAIAEVIQEAI